MTGGAKDPEELLRFLLHSKTTLYFCSYFKKCELYPVWTLFFPPAAFGKSHSLPRFSWPRTSLRGPRSASVCWRQGRSCWRQGRRHPFRIGRPRFSAEAILFRPLASGVVVLRARHLIKFEAAYALIRFTQILLLVYQDVTV